MAADRESPAASALSVCLCTHNPRASYLERVLDGLAGQSLAQDKWELVIVDNQSAPPLANRLDLTGFERARVVQEPRLGLTPARIRAAQEATGELLVFVDDDNVLTPGYLEAALDAMAAHPKLGVAGGPCAGAFETPPPPWTQRFHSYLALRDLSSEAIVSERPTRYALWFPWGAGLVIRRALARRWADSIQGQTDRMALGRRGDELAGSEDLDLVFTAIDAGAEIGYFPSLWLEHLIPASRLELKYLARLVYASHRSSIGVLTAHHMHRGLRPWPLEYLTSLIDCWRHGGWHPLAWWVALQGARGYYAGKK